MSAVSERRRLQTHRVDIADVREVHVVLGELLENVIVVDRLWSQVLVASELSLTED